MKQRTARTTSECAQPNLAHRCPTAGIHSGGGADFVLYRGCTVHTVHCSNGATLHYNAVMVATWERRSHFCSSSCKMEAPVKKKQRVLATRPVSVATPGGVVSTVDVPEMCTVLEMKTMLAAKVRGSAIDYHLVHGTTNLVEGVAAVGGGFRVDAHGDPDTEHLRPDCIRRWHSQTVACRVR